MSIPWGWPPVATGSSPVTSVFGRIGAIVAALGDYAASLITNDSGVAGATVASALDTLAAAIPSVPVSSVFARTGAVIAVAGDYAASKITNDSSVAGADVKAALNALLAAAPYYGTYAGRPAAGTAGRIATLTDAPVSTWVDSGSAWQPMINTFRGVEAPAIAGYTWVNQGAATSADQKGATRIVGVNDGAAPGQLRGMVIANSAATAYARGVFRFTLAGDTTANHVAGASVALRESGTGKIYVCQLIQDFANNVTSLGIAVWSSATARTTFVAKGYANFDLTAPIAMRVRRSGANVVSEISRDGLDWVQIDSRTTASVFTAAPDQAGWFITGINVTPQADLISFEQGS